MTSQLWVHDTRLWVHAPQLWPNWASFGQTIWVHDTQLQVHATQFWVHDTQHVCVAQDKLEFTCQDCPSDGVASPYWLNNTSGFQMWISAATSSDSGKLA